MPYQAVNGIQIYYEEQGAGEPLILINGLAFPMDLWFAQIQALSGHFRVIALDNRGIGRSGQPDEEYSIKQMASDTVGLMTALGINKAHVAGLSMGGFIAQEIALSYPERVDRLVLIATGMGGARSRELSRPFWEKTMVEIQGKTPEQIYRIDLTMMTAPGFAARHADVIEKGVALRLKHIQPLHAFLRQSGACAVFDSGARAGNISQPTMIILGDKDPIFPIPLAEDFRQTLPRAEMIVYENCGHAILLEKPDQLSRDIREFLKARVKS
jgi:pimeloyl-ACP methyl ester carboxylesterase